MRAVKGAKILPSYHLYVFMIQLEELLHKFMGGGKKIDKESGVWKGFPIGMCQMFQVGGISFIGVHIKLYMIKLF